MHRLFCVFLLWLSGCATIIHGTTQDIGMSSTPTGAAILVDQMPRGTTPAIVPLARNANHTIRMELAGYQPFETTVTQSSTSGWIAGNILIGGLIGLGVDAVSGALYNLSPAQIAAVLVPEASPASPGQLAAQEPAPLVSPDVTAAPLSTPPEHPSLATIPPQPTALTHPYHNPPRSEGVVQLQARYAGTRLALQPRTGAEQLSPVAAGVALHVIDTRDAWLYIQTPDERRGWLLREWMQP